MREQTCATCRYPVGAEFGPVPVPWTDEVGKRCERQAWPADPKRCHAGPPVTVEGMWPVVRADGWCGRWQARIVEEGETP